VLVGINLLREGLDLPEVALVAILDADKEGFLRSAGSLIQTIGRAARNVEGRVVLYADTITDSMKRAIEETERRREVQMAYNLEHGITPESIKKSISDVLSSVSEKDYYTVPATPDVEKSGRLTKEELSAQIEQLEKEMRAAAKRLEFERAAEFRDQIREMEKHHLGIVEG
jgi:excinuclease ABC subunit B